MEVLLGAWRGAGLVESHPVGVVHPAPKGGKRGAVTILSPASRRRLMRKLATVRIDAFAGALFITLTYPDLIPASCKVQKDFKRFRERLDYLFPAACGFWRVEVKERLSGVCLGLPAPHLHVLTFGVDWIPFEWLQKAWWESVGSGDLAHFEAGTHIERVSDVGRARRYISKYVAKEWDVEMVGLGRRWGTFGDLEKVQGSFEFQELTVKGASKIARVCDGLKRSVVRRRKFKNGRAIKWSRKRVKVQERSAYWLTDADVLGKLSAS